MNSFEQVPEGNDIEEDPSERITEIARSLVEEEEGKLARKKTNYKILLGAGGTAVVAGAAAIFAKELFGADIPVSEELARAIALSGVFATQLGVYLHSRVSAKLSELREKMTGLDNNSDKEQSNP